MKRNYFKVNGITLASCDGDVTQRGLEQIKRDIALTEGIDIEDISITLEDAPEEIYSGLEVSPSGMLLVGDDEVIGAKCIMNIHRNVDRFLDRINDGTILNTIVFIYKG